VVHRGSKESWVTQREMDIACSNTPAAANGADAYTIAARPKARLIVARRNLTRVARRDALVARIGVARAAMLGIVHNEG
jgi:hypothetical protein